MTNRVTEGPSNPASGYLAGPVEAVLLDEHRDVLALGEPTQYAPVRARTSHRHPSGSSNGVGIGILRVLIRYATVGGRVQLLLLPGMDGTGRLFAPLLACLPPSLTAITVSYPLDKPLGYDGLLTLVEEAARGLDDFLVVGESFSGPLALMLASRNPPGIRGVVLCASFVRFPLSIPEQWRGMVRPWMFRIQPTWLISLVLLGRHAWGPVGRLLRESIRSVSPEALGARAAAVAGVDVHTWRNRLGSRRERSPTPDRRWHIGQKGR